MIAPIQANLTHKSGLTGKTVNEFADEQLIKWDARSQHASVTREGHHHPRTHLRRHLLCAYLSVSAGATDASQLTRPHSSFPLLRPPAQVPDSLATFTLAMMFSKSTALFAVCAVAAAQFQAATAIDYLGGWLPTPPKQQCVDICVNSKAAPTCPTSDPDCLTKKQRPFDYDYLLLEQIYIPQYCRDLLKGVDSTISHQNVNAYPNGITCKPAQAAKAQMTIHGLWPNYNAGYAGCCNVSDMISNHPYNALSFAEGHTSLLQEMKAEWIDPTQANEYDTMCEIYNHEFQKHGICYGAFGDNWDQSAATYFRATLNAAATTYSATSQLNKWAKLATPQTTLAAITALYSKQVQVLCSAADGGNQLSAIRTCYKKPTVANTNKGPFYPIDCANATKSSAFIPCDGAVPITLNKYVAPQ